MASETSSTSIPEQIVHSTERLLAQGGLSNASLNSVAAASAVPRGSLLYYFPAGKSQIVQAALKAHDDTFSARMQDTLVPAEGFGGSLRDLMLGTARRMKADGFSSGCPVAGVVLDLAEGDEELRSVCAGIVRGWETALGGALTQLDKAQRQQTAEFIMAAYEGAILMAKLKRSTAPLLNAARHILVMLAALS